MQDEHEETPLANEQKGKLTSKGGKGRRVGRSRTLVLPTRRAGSHVRFREKESEDDVVNPQSPHPITPRSSELKWMRELRSERNKPVLSSNQRTSFSSFPHGMIRNNSSRASSPGRSSTATSPRPSQRSSSRVSSPHIADLRSHTKTERSRNGRGSERRSRSLAGREPRRRSSSTNLSSRFSHGEGKGLKLQESTSSSRESDGSRGRTSFSLDLGRSVSDRSSGVRTRKSSGSKREGSLRSPTRSPQSDRRLANVELAMALPEEDTLEKMFKLKSDCSGSESETMSMKGIVSSLIAIENEEM